MYICYYSFFEVFGKDYYWISVKWEDGYDGVLVGIVLNYLYK